MSVFFKTDQQKQQQKEKANSGFQLRSDYMYVSSFPYHNVKQPDTLSSDLDWHKYLEFNLMGWHTAVGSDKGNTYSSGQDHLVARERESVYLH